MKFGADVDFGILIDLEQFSKSLVGVLGGENRLLGNKSII